VTAIVKYVTLRCDNKPGRAIPAAGNRELNAWWVFISIPVQTKFTSNIIGWTLIEPGSSVDASIVLLQQTNTSTCHRLQASVKCLGNFPQRTLAT
jgi:hypothetical protein